MMRWLALVNLPVLFFVLQLSCYEVSADLQGSYAVMQAENTTHSISICYVYFPQFYKLPTSLEESKYKNITYLDVDTVCNGTFNKDLKGKVVLVNDRHCGNLQKAYYVQNLGAWGIIIIRDAVQHDKAIDSPNVSVDDLKITIGMIANEDNSSLLELGKNTVVRLYAVSDPKVDYSFMVIWILAVFATVTGSYWSGMERFKVYEIITQTNQERNEEDDEEVCDNEEENVNQSLTNSSNQYRTLSVSVPMVLCFVIGACTTLVLLYFFFSYVVKVLIVIFTIFLALAFATLLQFFLHKIETLRRRFTWKKLSITTGEILSLFIAAAPAIWFYIVRKGSYAWVLQDMFGVSLIVVALKEIRMPSLRIITCLLVLLFVYDIFFVFITPFFTKSRHVNFFQTGESIMVSVALGANGEELPITLKVPRFNPTSIKHCNLYSLLGFGDMLAPGLLVSYCHGFDLENKLKRVYFLISSFAYGLGLCAAFVALFLMKAAQPALLYLVPFTLIPVILTSLYRKEFRQLWYGVQQPKSPEVKESENTEISSNLTCAAE